MSRCPACKNLSFALARRVAAVYNELCMTPGPSRVTAGKARGLGFLPPLAWDDLIDVPDADLAAELARRVAQMDDDELARCANARYKHGDRSVLIGAGAREHNRRKVTPRTEVAA